MEEFLKDNYILITRGVEILAAVTGLLFYKKYKNTAATYFIWFLVYITICDFLCGYTYYVKNIGFLNFLGGTLFEKNYWLSTLYWKIGAVLFFTFYYYKILKTKQSKLFLKYTGYSFLLFSLIYIIVHFQEYFIRSFPIISVLGALIISICVVLYYIEVLQSEKILSFYKSLNFYISTAIFIWWLIITPLVFYSLYFTKADWNFVILKWQIYLFANIFMYTTFTIGLIVSKPQSSVS
ncbi:hypothetical protein [Lacinutrix sp. Bg11-31]|uniref:hypothetical protein n=1 Tax=Lacinutrix sp. Bg11-31 TaxID=2057808 RepID=UPI000C303CB3|nr:hypothetical protein [Lacinutrix sp. Bg11-31]AUC81242.1 hypothetical protein CW733_03465 [Lacinutrix sp. Bg11-31]